MNLGPVRGMTTSLLMAGLVMSCTGETSAPHPLAGPTTPASGPVATESTATPPTPSTPTPTASPAGQGPCGVTTIAPSHYRHVVWIWMENHNWQQVLGDPAAAPYETGLARRCATATHYASVGSPSLPNYVAATSGDTHGIHDDGAPATHPLNGDNLFRQVRAAGGDERSFEEAMGASCRLDSAGTYGVRHNPAAYYVGGNDRSACASDDVDFGELARQLAAGTLPTFAFITPDVCHDTHDCPVAAGDAWLAQWVPRILASPGYRDGSTVVFVVWDEYTPMPNVIVGPSVPPSSTVTQAFDHYSLLRTTEELLGLPLLGRAADAASMRGAFQL